MVVLSPIQTRLPPSCARKLVSLADRLKVGALELRNSHPSGAGWPVKELYFTFRKTIEPDDEANLMAIPNRQRAMIRKGIKEGLLSEWDENGTDRLYQGVR